MVVTVALVGLLIDLDEEPVRSEWQYDCYIPSEGATAADGSLELVTIGDESYIHAKALGAGSYTDAGGTAHTVEVQKGVLDLFIFAGQSNAAYYNSNGALDPASVDPVPAPGTAYYFGTDTRYDRLYHASLGGTPEFRSFTASDGSAALGDKGAPFAGVYNELTGNRVYFVCIAISGQSIVNMDPPSGPGWTYALRVVDDAMDAVDPDLFTVVPRSYVWIQGESDREMAPSEYAERFEEINSRILSGGLGVSMDHCFVSKLNSRYAGTGGVLGMEEVVENNPSVSYAASAWDFSIDAGTLASDGVHYSQKGDNIIASELAHSCVEWYDSRHDGAAWQIVHVVPVIIVLGLAVLAASVLILRRY